MRNWPTFTPNAARFMSVNDTALAAGGFVSFRGRIEECWIDANGHMNVLGYDHMFQSAELAFFDHHGAGTGYPASGLGYFRLEKHVRHHAELRLDEMVAVTTLLVWTDYKRVHMLHQAWNLATGARAAVMEALSIHVDLATRRSTPLVDPAMRVRWAETLAAHDMLARPEGIGRAITVTRGA